MSPYTYARPSPSWPGERSTWAIARGELNLTVGPAPLLGHLAAVPELDRERPVGQRPLDLAAQGGGASARHGASAYRYGKPAVSGGD